MNSVINIYTCRVIERACACRCALLAQLFDRTRSRNGMANLRAWCLPGNKSTSHAPYREHEMALRSWSCHSVRLCVAGHNSCSSMQPLQHCAGLTEWKITGFEVHVHICIVREPAASSWTFAMAYRSHEAQSGLSLCAHSASERPLAAETEANTRAQNV